MDELDLISRALPEARPLSPEVVAQARARVATARAPRHRSRAWTWTWAGAAIGTAAVVGVVALVANMAEPAAPILASQAKPNQALYDLADKVEQLKEPTTGRYWSELKREGEGGKTATEDRWVPRVAADDPVLIKRSYKKSCVVHRLDLGGRWPDTGLGEFSMVELGALPSDQAALERKLRGFHKVWYDRGFKDSFEDFLPGAASLLSMPVKPAVRASVLRILAAAPHTRVHGTATDPLGRPGLLVTFAKPGAGGTIGKVAVSYRTFLNPSDGRWLAVVALADKDQRVVSYSALVSGGWVDERPLVPKGCKLKG
ncbi:hypothetical protein [Nonomuraea longicatena]|uniref:Uncharacterized protein n=1 Tax=Nonomuraea longicatena TaxID=83682 RepID=A0ABP4BU88_9ACTN